MEKQIGEVIYFFNKAEVMVVKLSNSLSLEDVIKVKGGKREFEQTVNSMQVNGEDINEAQKGEEVAIKIKDNVKEGDKVYKLTE
ncbi:MAG: translation elongation factor-like protein [Candidatus Paceibacterota bacterium]